MRGTPRRRLLLGFALALTATVLACGTARSRDAERAELTVTEFITGWVAASEIAHRGLFATPNIHRLLAPPFACVDNYDRLRPERTYAAMMMVPVAPDGVDDELFELKSTTIGGDVVAVEVRLLYTGSLFRGRAARGPPFGDLMRFAEELEGGLVRTFFLERSSDGWLIFRVVEGSATVQASDAERDFDGPCTLPPTDQRRA